MYKNLCLKTCVLCIQIFILEEFLTIKIVQKR